MCLWLLSHLVPSFNSRCFSPSLGLSPNQFPCGPFISLHMCRICLHRALLWFLLLGHQYSLAPICLLIYIIKGLQPRLIFWSFWNLISTSVPAIFPIHQATCLLTLRRQINLASYIFLQGHIRSNPEHIWRRFCFFFYISINPKLLKREDESSQSHSSTEWSFQPTGCHRTEPHIIVKLNLNVVFKSKSKVFTPQCCLFC